MICHSASRVTTGSLARTMMNKTVIDDIRWGEVTVNEEEGRCVQMR